VSETLPLIGTTQGRELLEALADELSVNPSGLLDLLRASEQHSGKLRRKGLFQAFDVILEPGTR
jgi:hypothetical protein